MSLDPAVQAVLQQIEAAEAPPLSDTTPQMAREAFAGLVAFQGEPEAVAAVEDRDVPGPGGAIPIRVYRPEGAPQPAPTLFYIHGGGWVLMDLETHDPICRALANAAGCVVVAAHYRRAPEAPFPAAVEDCYAVLRFLAEPEAAALGVDAGRLAVGGDSAGGNLAAAMTLLCRDRGAPTLAAQLLHCPVTDRDFTRPSYGENGVGYLLTEELMRWFYGHYLRSELEAYNPLVSPLRAADLGGLPPALVQTAAFDPLRDEGAAYAERLRKAGVETEYCEVEGAIHDPLLFFGVVPEARRTLDEAAAFLRRTLDRS